MNLDDDPSGSTLDLREKIRILEGQLP